MSTAGTFDDHEAWERYWSEIGSTGPHADYLVVNVSSPNTPGLRDLQAVDKLRPLLAAVRRQADAVTSAHHGKPRRRDLRFGNWV